MRLVLRLLREALRALVLPILWLRRRLAAPDGGYLALEIDGHVRDVVAPRRFWDWRRRHAVSLYELARRIDLAIADPRVRGLVVTVKEPQCGMATAQSLRELLARARASRDVVVHLPIGVDTMTMYIASGASRVFVGPRASVAPLGFARHVRYAKRAFDKLGVVPEVYAMGRYKSAGEQATRESMSDEQREQMGALYDVFYDQVIDGIAEGRKISRDVARALVDEAPYRAAEAHARGLIDGGAYEDEIAGCVGVGGGEPAKIVPVESYARARRAATFRRVVPSGVIGVIEVRGAIAHSGRPSFGAICTDEAVMAAVRAARVSRRVRGVVLLVDSPGGSALASDRMHHELAHLAAEKPLVACMGDVAASGGYYVSAPAHVIVAQPTTITGSIGVVAARAAIDPLLERLGIFTEVVQRGAHAELGSATRAFTAEEQTALRRELEATYRDFVQIVADGRRRSVEEIGALAEGRVWTGADAKRVGLVDELGGFDVALAAVRARIGAGASKLEPAIVRAPRGIPPLEPPKAKGPAVIGEWLAAAGVDPDDLAPLGFALSGERVLAWCGVR